MNNKSTSEEGPRKGGIRKRIVRGIIRLGEDSTKFLNAHKIASPF